MTVTKFDNYSDAELIRMVDNSANATELEIALAERLDMRIRDLSDTTKLWSTPNHDQTTLY